ncbi:hypothetical protein FCM35_KLT06792 [Carex littledalei]|uniref:Uncharacterized protein n=1 Tax=Carex littledalei TaxID=544730 RepID=A0A833QUL6_9POAL|nr:hypothetical protein FCM35_KLT06792 [Carex littledalei]
MEPHRIPLERNLAANPTRQLEWQLVRRKRRYPDHWRAGGMLSSEATLPRTKIYVPYQDHPTYAQVVANCPDRQNPAPTSAVTVHHQNPSPTARTPTLTPITTPVTSPATSPPTSPRSPTYYLSPHSPTPLCFPPSPKFSEWKGRCFRCCRVGHSIAVCRNPPKCGRCWRNDHTGSTCAATDTKPSPMPTGPLVRAEALVQVQPRDPDFNELLTGPRPINPAPLPPNRPSQLKCFVDVDADYHQKVHRLQQAIVVDASAIPINFELSVDKVAEWVAKANVIPERQLTIATLTDCKFLIPMPYGLAPETLVEAIPYEVWDEGLTFHQWDPLRDGRKISPQFKIMVDLEGIPPPLYREKTVIEAVSTFGVYLGTVAQQNPASLASWTVVVATEKLENVP